MYKVPTTEQVNDRAMLFARTTATLNSASSVSSEIAGRHAAASLVNAVYAVAEQLAALREELNARSEG